MIVIVFRCDYSSPLDQPFILFNWQKVVKFQDINNLSHSPHDEIFEFVRKKLEARTGSC